VLACIAADPCYEYILALNKENGCEDKFDSAEDQQTYLFSVITTKSQIRSVIQCESRSTPVDQPMTDVKFTEGIL